jgi:hypothetical protein
MLKGNEKRINTCKKIGKDIKIKGHKREKDFLKQYNYNELNNPIEYGAKSDTSIDLSNPICNKLRNLLNVSGFNVSNKSGNNIQFTLGKIPELLDIDTKDFSHSFLRELFNKYLKKNNSDKPVDILVYKDIENRKWIFFNINHIIDFIINNCVWRKLDSGRIKGDFYDNSKKGISQYITYEYRNTHKSYFLGLNGGTGKKFINLLKSNIDYYSDNFNY